MQKIIEIKECPKGYVSQIEGGKLPPACCLNCPIAHGKKDIPNALYTTTTAAKDPLSPLHGRYTAKHGADLPINFAVWRNNILTVSVVPNELNAVGRGNRMIPHCALMAYRDRQEMRAETNRLRQQYRGNVLEDTAQILDGTPRVKMIEKALKREIRKENAAKRRKHRYVPASGAAIGREFGVSRQAVNEVKHKRGIK